MRRPWWISAALGWVGVVAAVALVTWWVIDSAGEEVLAEQAQEVVTPPATTPPATTPTGSTTATDNARPTDRATEDPWDPISSPTTAATPPETTSAVAPVRRTSSWQGPEGLVQVSCTGSELRLEGASPADGYEVDTNTRHSGGELEVRFRAADGDREVEVLATCAGGVPQFRTERD